MSMQLPSAVYYNLVDLDINLKKQVIEYNTALLDRLNTRTLSSIKNAFARAILVLQNGLCYVKISELNHLLRTGNSGAENYYWQHGIQGYVSPSSPHTFGNDIYISGPDFCGLLDARIQATSGNINLYLRYVRAIYVSITSSSIFHDLRSSFVCDVNNRRNQLKERRIKTYRIANCEFTNIYFNNLSEVQFAHVESVATAPLQALNIDNGVIILKEIHNELTWQNIHDFAGMYDFCVEKGYSTVWADNYRF